MRRKTCLAEWRFLGVALFLLLLSSSLVRADELTRRTQEELRKRNLYFGNVDGQMNSELARAIKKYQARKGFAETGEIDEETSRALNIPYNGAAKSSSTQWPDIPVLKSDVARRIPEPERHALEQKAEQNLENPSASADSASSNLARPPLDRSAAATPEPPPPADGPSPTPAIKSEEITRFVQDYLRDAETDDVNAQIRYYAFPVDYFDHGRVDHDFVSNDTRNYVKRWPQRKYTLLGPVEFSGTDKENEAQVEFTIAFNVAGGKRAVNGKTRNFWTVKRDGNLQIVAIKEQRLHE